MAYAFCDMQTLRGAKDEYVVKEFSLYSSQFDGSRGTTIFKPPYADTILSPEQRKRNSYITRHIHGLKWNSGTVPYEHFGDMIQELLRDYNRIYVKGVEKLRLLLRQEDEASENEGDDEEEVEEGQFAADLRADINRRRRERVQDFDLEEEEPGLVRQRRLAEGEARGGQDQDQDPRFFMRLLDTIVNRPQQKIKKYNDVPKYNGETDYSVFQVQFNTLSEANEWDERDRKTALLQALVGNATDVIANLQHQGTEITFATLDEALVKMYSKTASMWERKKDFNTLVQERDQTVRQFARQVETLGRSYLRNMKEEDIQEALVERFTLKTQQ
ncbi:Protein Vpu [Frankliniella fusca]|uniref:Protein Vpu n=1 Tax=Frankliniella fusca TaxID=407009 RepID=A0AAE1HEE7_9NEOP|nr:Protein Vpu [Frankliniella fusca]